MKYAPDVEEEIQRLLSGGDPHWEPDDPSVYDAPRLDPVVAVLADDAISRIEQPERDAAAAARQRRADELAAVDLWHGAPGRA